MDGTSLLFGSVGAVSGVKNPILVAQRLVEEQGKGLLPLGRVPPGFLVGEGAREWAVRHNVPTIKTEHLISEKAAKLYRHHKKKLDAYKMSVGNAKRKRELSRSGSGNLEKCKRLKQSSDLLDSTDHVRSSDGATTSKLFDRNSSLATSDGCDLLPSDEEEEEEVEDEKVQDTVGVVVLDRA